VKQAAQALGIHENTLRRWEAAGFVDAVRLPSGVRRFRAEDIEMLRTQIYGRSRSADLAVEAVTQSEASAAPGGVRRTR
jgi:DNA-binding transcriptional MerR regulator